MLTYASGAAFLDRTGSIVVADPGFLAALSLPAQDPGGALQARAAQSPTLGRLLGGGGPDAVLLDAGEGGLELRRCACEGGVLLLVRTGGLQEHLEHAQRSLALSRVIAGVAHDIKNPLNAMALQLAILTEKLSGEGEATVPGTPQLGALREQIGRVNEVVRRFLEVTDPSAPLGYVEIGALLGDVSALFAHEARRRRIQLVSGAPRVGARVEVDPARVGRALLVLLAGAMAATPDGGRVEAEVEVEDGRPVLRLAHAVGDGEGEPGYDVEVITATASALGGALAVRQEDGVRRIELRLPGIERT